MQKLRFDNLTVGRETKITLQFCSVVFYPSIFFSLCFGDFNGRLQLPTELAANSFDTELLLPKILRYNEKTTRDEENYEFKNKNRRFLHAFRISFVSRVFIN